MYINGEGVEANQEKAIEALKKAVELGDKDAQTTLDKITKLYDDDRWAVINVLSIVYSETNRIEQRFNSFLKTVENNNITQAIRDAQNNRQFLLRLDKSQYNSKDKVKDSKAKKMLDDLVEAHNNANTQLWAYFDEFLDYVDEQKPSQLVEMENNLKFYQNRKLAVITQSVGLSSKYKIGFDDEKGHWRTNEDIEADKTKREKKQKDAKKNKPFINANNYNKKSAQYAVANFITAWQYRDFKEMAKYIQTSWRERENSPHGGLANNYDFKFLTSAKLGKAKCNDSLCNIPVTITYKNDINGKTETHTIKPNVIKESGKWGVNPISAIREY